MILPLPPYRAPTQDEMDAMTLSPEGGRACYTLYHYFCSEQVPHRHPIYPMQGGLSAVAKNHKTKWYLTAAKAGERLEDSYAQYLDRLGKNDAEIKKMEDYLTSHRARARNSFPTDLTGVSAQELKKYFKTYCDIYWNMMVTAGYLRKTDRAVVTQLKKVLTGKENADEKLTIAGTPAKTPFNTAEQIAVLELAGNIVDGKVRADSREYSERIGNLVDSFAWSEMGYYDEKAKTDEHYKQRVSRALDHDSEEELRDLADRQKNERTERERLAVELGQDGYLVSIASWAAYLKDYYKACVNELEYRGEGVFQEIAKRSGYSVEYIKDLIPSEIEDLIDGKKLDEQMIAERTKLNVLIGLPDAFCFLIGDDAKAFINKHLAAGDAGAKEFKGRVASKGKAVGAARIILGGSDFHKLTQGDILVVTNTSPDFVAIMKKAGAIVAEEGGLTAHVSVVSREFGIPCIVGVERATEIFKDGDRVEVDAQNGIVKILQRGN